MAKKQRTTTDAVKILHNLFIKGDSQAEKMLKEAREQMDIAQKIYDLREQAGLSQKQLADLIGTTQSVISRLEDADYKGHSLEILRRIAHVLHCRLEVKIVPEDKYAHAS